MNIMLDWLEIKLAHIVVRHILNDSTPLSCDIGWNLTHSMKYIDSK